MASKTFSKNRGEWSELYSLGLILSRGIIKISTSTGDVEQEVRRVRRKSKDFERTYRTVGADVFLAVLENDGFGTEKIIAKQELADLTGKLLEEIKNGAGRSFETHSGPLLMKLLGLEQVMGETFEKGDISIDVYDPRVSSEVTKSFSIKSFLGANPTLFNASGVTNFIYRIDPLIDATTVNELNKLGPVHLVRALLARGHTLEFVSIDNRFRENLELIDNQLPLLVGAALVQGYAVTSRTIRDVSQVLTDQNPLNYTDTSKDRMYGHKLKVFLNEIALGMTPSAEWTGSHHANGGLMVVLPDGEIVANTPEDSHALREELFSSTKFETPSTSRHNFGKIFQDDDSYFLKLNLQIRFI